MRHSRKTGAAGLLLAGLFLTGCGTAYYDPCCGDPIVIYVPPPPPPYPPPPDYPAPPSDPGRDTPLPKGQQTGTREPRVKQPRADDRDAGTGARGDGGRTVTKTTRGRR